MDVTVNFYSYLKDFTGCAHLTETLPDGSTLNELIKKLGARFPKLEAAERSILLAVGVDYQKGTYLLKQGDEISLFPPVQGG